ncbi:hypothetical protein C8R45DRAFT_945413 [Mycena sanguinolenta]|nr:hypothetical protein C8R45DRAFT_945413 [Mycena sanguinolenta]
MIAQRSLCIAVALSFLCGVSYAQQPSSAPSCTASCPTDRGGRGAFYSFDWDGILVCEYGEFDVCFYDSSSGALVEDADSGLCPDDAPVSCANRRRYKGEDNYTAFLRKRNFAAMNLQASEARKLTANSLTLKGRRPSATL